MIPPDGVALSAKRWFDSQGRGDFENILLRCTAWGVVVKNPYLFLMAEPTWTDGKELKYEGEGMPNCWWIHWLSGHIDLKYFMSLSEPVEYIGWENKRRKMKFYKWDKLYVN